MCSQARAMSGRVFTGFCYFGVDQVLFLYCNYEFGYLLYKNGWNYKERISFSV